jgi:DNA primase
MVGVDPQQALTEVRRSVARRPASTTTAPAPQQPAGPDPRDPRFALERETLKVLIQHPMAVGRLTAEMTTADFMHPAYQAVWALIQAAGGPGAGTGDQGWAARLAAAAPTPAVAGVVSALAVEPLPSRRTPDAAYVTEHVVRLLEASLQRQIADAHSRLQRADPTADPDGYRALFEELAGLEHQRRALRDRVLGG